MLAFDTWRAETRKMELYERLERTVRSFKDMLYQLDEFKESDRVIYYLAPSHIGSSNGRLFIRDGCPFTHKRDCRARTWRKLRRQNINAVGCMVASCWLSKFRPVGKNERGSRQAERVAEFLDGAPLPDSEQSSLYLSGLARFIAQLYSKEGLSFSWREAHVRLFFHDEPYGLWGSMDYRCLKPYAPDFHVFAAMQFVNAVNKQDEFFREIGLAAKGFGTTMPSEMWGYRSLKGEVELAKGSYGAVTRGRIGNNDLVKKTSKIKGASEACVFIQELIAMRRLQRVSGVVEVCAAYFFSEAKSSCRALLYMRFAGTRLLDYAPMAPERAVLVARDLAKVLGEIHRLGIIHGDLNIKNIVVLDGTLKLCDFGLSMTQTEWQKRAVYTITAASVRAPEVFLGKCPYTDKIDIFSLAMTIVTLVTNSTFVPNAEGSSCNKIMLLFAEIIGNIVQYKPFPQKELEEHLGNEAFRVLEPFLRRALDPNPITRASAKECVEIIEDEVSPQGERIKKVIA